MPDLVNMRGSRSFLLEQPQRSEVARARPHHEIFRRHRLEIVVEHVGSRVDHDLDRAVLAQEVGRQHLDRGARIARSDRPDGVREMLRAAVVKIVAIDRSHDHMGKPELRHRVGDVLRFGRFERARQSGLDVAEGAGARAHVAHDHEGGVALLPALADVGAARLLAHGMQAVLAHDPARLRVAGRARRLHPDPRRLAQYRRLRPARLLGMARPNRRSCKRIDQNRHARLVGLLLTRAVVPPQGKRGDRPVRHRRRIACQISRNTTAPIVAVIKLPPKSCTTTTLNFSNR